MSQPRIDLVSQTGSEGNTDQFDKPQVTSSCIAGLYRSIFIRRGRFIKNDLSLQNIVNNSGGDDNLDVTR